MSEWIIELVNTIGLIVGFALMFYFGRITGENNVAESERRYEVLYQKEVLQRKVYYEKYNDIHYVLENLTGDDVKLLTKDNWNTIILKKNKRRNYCKSVVTYRGNNTKMVKLKGSIECFKRHSIIWQLYPQLHRFLFLKSNL